jgi:site-specific DNA recombinase
VDGRSVVVIEDREAANVKYIFSLYAYQNCTLDMVLEKLHSTGRNYTPKQPKWNRSKIHRILRDRSYIGDIKWHGHWQVGRHQPLVERVEFDRVQALLGDKVYKAHELTYASELITCGHCGRPVTGEIVEKKSSGKCYIYYRCARYTAKDHPRIRLREEQIDQEMLALFDSIRQPQPVQDWFRTALLAMSTSQHE